MINNIEKSPKKIKIESSIDKTDIFKNKKFVIKNKKNKKTKIKF